MIYSGGEGEDEGEESEKSEFDPWNLGGDLYGDVEVNIDDEETVKVAAGGYDI